MKAAALAGLSRVLPGGVQTWYAVCMEIRSLLTTAINAALAAGDKILEVYESDDFDVEIKKDNSPLTRADLVSHETISRILTDETPGIPILGEEGREIPYGERKSWSVFWLVDPLDGTKEFVKKNGEFTVNIALIKDKHAVLGVLYVPVKDIIYFAAEGIGSFRAESAAKHAAAAGREDGGRGVAGLLDAAVKLPLDDGRKIPPVKIVASRSHFTPETEQYVEKIRSAHGSVDLVNAGSSLKICLVAEGAADVYPRFGPTMEWDVAAGQIIAEEAGCTVTDAETRGRLAYNKKELLNPYFIVERAGWNT